MRPGLYQDGMRLSGPEPAGRTAAAAWNPPRGRSFAAVGMLFRRQFDRTGTDSPMPARQTFKIAAALLLPSMLAACAGEPVPPQVQPTFYQDLASPGAAVDESRAVEMISAYRAKSGAGPLSLDPELSRIAAAYAREIAAADRMSHSLTEEAKLGNRLRAEGYAFVAAGENIAAGYRTLAEAFSGWRDSPRHDRGMKDPEMTVMGIGTAYNPNSKYKVFWCLILAKPKAAAGTPGVEGGPALVSAGGVPLAR